MKKKRKIGIIKLIFQFCCYDGVHDDADAECEPWKPVTMRRERGTKTIFQNTKDEPFDTKKHQVSSDIECTYANEFFGCLNGFPYDWEVIL